MGENWVATDFTTAEIREEDGVKMLVVRGETTSRSTTDEETVKLVPVDYFVQPEYWRIYVRWDRDGAIFTAMTPYEATLPLENCTGSKGVEVFGGEKSVRIDS